MNSVPPIEDRPCPGCGNWVTDDDVIDTWGDTPHSLQVICYECPECGAVTGYFRSEVPDSDEYHHSTDKEFFCPTRTVYDRLYGDSDAFVQVANSETIAVPADVYDHFADRGLTDTSFDGITFAPADAAPSDVQRIERGMTVALPDAAFDAIHSELFGDALHAGSEWDGDWYMTRNIRFVRAGSEAAAHHDPSHDGEV